MRMPEPTALDTTDAELLRHFTASRDEAAFSELVRRHAPLVHGVCRRRLNDAALAEDAAQAVFLILARKATGLTRSGSLAGWLYRTADLVARTMQRERRNRTKHERATCACETYGGVDGVDEHMELLRARLDDALLLLKDSDREAIVVHYLEGVGQEAAAGRLGLSYEVYRQRLARALDRLRGHLGPCDVACSTTVLAVALGQVSRVDAAECSIHALHTWTHCALGTTLASPASVLAAKGVLKHMLIKHLALVTGWAAVLPLCVCAWLAAGEPRAPDKPDTPAYTDKPAGPQTPVRTNDVPATHLLLAEVKGVGTPVFSPDGHWLAIRERDDKLALIDVAATLKDPQAQPKRYDLAPAVKRNMWSEAVFGQPAAFSADGKRMIFTSREGLLWLELPPAKAPQPFMAGYAPLPVKLGPEYVPALNAGALKSGEGYRLENWPLLKIDPNFKLQAPDPGGGEITQDPTLVMYRWGVEGNEPRMEGPKIRSELLAWAPGGKELLVTLKDGSAAVVDPFTAKVTKLLDIAAFEKEVSKEFEALKTWVVTPDGKYVIEGTRKFPAGMHEISGPYMPGGDEKPERGENPGSTEGGPPMPRYIYLYEGQRRSKIWMASVARAIDTLFIVPSAKADKYLFFQVANAGGAGSGVPHAWIGQLDASGQRTEKDLGNPFAKTVDAPTFTLLQTAPDASKALVLMNVRRKKRISKQLDEETRKALKEQLKQSRQGVHRDGPDEALEMMVGSLLAKKYERGGYDDAGQEIILSFCTWQIWELDGVKQKISALSPEFGEAIGELDGVTGIPGAPLGEAPAFNSPAGLLAQNLRGKYQLGDKRRESRGLLLIKVPGW